MGRWLPAAGGHAGAQAAVSPTLAPVPVRLWQGGRGGTCGQHTHVLRPGGSRSPAFIAARSKTGNAHCNCERPLWPPVPCCRVLPRSFSHKTYSMNARDGHGALHTSCRQSSYPQHPTRAHCCKPADPIQRDPTQPQRTFDRQPLPIANQEPLDFNRVLQSTIQLLASPTLHPPPRPPVRRPAPAKRRR